MFSLDLPLTKYSPKYILIAPPSAPQFPISSIWLPPPPPRFHFLKYILIAPPSPSKKRCFKSSWTKILGVVYKGSNQVSIHFSGKNSAIKLSWRTRRKCYGEDTFNDTQIEETTILSPHLVSYCILYLVVGKRYLSPKKSKITSHCSFDSAKLRSIKLLHSRIIDLYILW